MRYTFVPRIDSNDKDIDIDRKLPVDSAETVISGDLEKQVSGLSSLIKDYLNNALQNLVDELNKIMPDPPDCILSPISSSDG